MVNLVVIIRFCTFLKLMHFLDQFSTVYCDYNLVLTFIDMVDDSGCCFICSHQTNIPPLPLGRFSVPLLPISLTLLRKATARLNLRCFDGKTADSFKFLEAYQ